MKPLSLFIAGEVPQRSTSVTMGDDSGSGGLISKEKFEEMQNALDKDGDGSVDKVCLSQDDRFAHFVVGCPSACGACRLRTSYGMSPASPDH